jgi:general secretion pathway protein K
MTTIMTMADSPTTEARDLSNRVVTPGGQCLPGERGFALLIVLFVLGFLALIETNFAATGRAWMAVARNSRAAAQVEAAAAGAIQAEMFYLLSGAGTAPRQLRIGATLVKLAVANESELLNPNLAGAAELTRLSQELGADTSVAASLAAAILDWRTEGTLPRPGGAKVPQYRAAGLVYGPASGPFRSVAEVGLVLGMPPALLERLRPHLTVFTGMDPIGLSGDPIVARAVQAAQPGGSAPTGGDLGGIAVERITASALGADGAATVLEAVVRLNATPGGLPFEIISWRRAAG